MSNLPFGVVPFLYINGLELSNNTTTPNTKLNVASGQCRDSTDVYQLVSDDALVIDATTTGLNGLDTSVLLASKVYAVHLVSDPVSGNATGAMISLSSTAPLLPFGYSAFRVIGYVVTDSSVHFLKGYWSGNNNGRLFMYDAPQATSVTAGASTSYADVALATFVPAIDNLPVWIFTDAIPSAASRVLSMQPKGATGDAIQITGQVATVHVTSNSLLLAKLSSSLPVISYKWSAGGGDAVAIKVAGYQFCI